MTERRLGWSVPSHLETGSHEKHNQHRVHYNCRPQENTTELTSYAKISEYSVTSTP